MVIRFTARTSLVLFCLAFSRRRAGAAVAEQHRPGGCAATAAISASRFAASHTIHAVAIAAFAVMDPAGYAAATLDRILHLRRHRLRLHNSDDRDLVRPHGRRNRRTRRRRLHLIGGYYLLFQFMVSFGKRIPDMPLYALFLIPLVAVFALRDDRDGAAAASCARSG